MNTRCDLFPLLLSGSLSLQQAARLMCDISPGIQSVPCPSLYSFSDAFLPDLHQPHLQRLFSKPGLASVDWAGKACGLGLFINFKMCAARSFHAVSRNSFWQPQNSTIISSQSLRWVLAGVSNSRISTPRGQHFSSQLILVASPPSSKSFQALVRGLILWMCQLSGLCIAQGRPLLSPSTFPPLTLRTEELSFTPRWWGRQRV